jgi:hypothetical protein
MTWRMDCSALWFDIHIAILTVQTHGCTSEQASPNLHGSNSKPTLVGYAFCCPTKTILQSAVKD